MFTAYAADSLKENRTGFPLPAGLRSYNRMARAKYKKKMLAIGADNVKKPVKRASLLSLSPPAVSA
jgi:hypothetical protein